MTITQDLKKIRKLAKRKGTPLTSVDYKGDKVVSFVYGSRSFYYPTMKKAVRKELERLA